MRQWMLRITAMAQRLIDDLDELSWPESVKQLQRNWIGASDGAIITMRRPMQRGSADRGVHDPAGHAVRRDVRRAGPGASAGRQPGGRHLAGRARPPRGAATRRDPRAAVAAYREATARLSDRQRTASGAKSGVFTGAYVINPVTSDPVPVFVADYVLMGYGTGAIMAVPAHDERDLAFAARA